MELGESVCVCVDLGGFFLRGDWHIWITIGLGGVLDLGMDRISFKDFIWLDIESRLVERVIWASCIRARRFDRVSWISRVAEVTDIILVVKYSRFALFSLNCFERFRDSLFEAIWLWISRSPGMY